MIQAARDTGILPRLAIVATDIFPALVEHIRAGSVLASIYQRAYNQGRMAFRVLYEFLVEGSCPAYQVTLAPHVVMRGESRLFPAAAVARIQNGQRGQAVDRCRGAGRLLGRLVLGFHEL